MSASIAACASRTVEAIKSIQRPTKWLELNADYAKINITVKKAPRLTQGVEASDNPILRQIPVRGRSALLPSIFEPTHKGFEGRLKTSSSDATNTVIQAVYPKSDGKIR
jgi:hypothetical protein